jgi:hypothetical protein
MLRGWGLFRFRDFTKRIEERNTKVPLDVFIPFLELNRNGRSMQKQL